MGKSYQVGDLVWVKPLNRRCITRFSKGQSDEVISSKTILVNGIPCHVKDLYPHYETTASGGDDHEGVSFDSKSGTLLLCRTWSDGSLAEPQETELNYDKDGDDTGNDTDPAVIVAEVMLPEESPTSLQRSVYWRESPPPCHLCDHEISGECVER